MVEIPDNLPSWIKDHVQLYLTDPEKAHMWDASLAGGTGVLPTLLLITKGRKSGTERPLPLIYKKIADNHVVIASKGGAPAHPSWYLNLQGNPDCEIRVGAAMHLVRARDAEGEEREDFWQQLTEIYPPYSDYKVSAAGATGRVIPVVVLEPR